MFFFFYETPYIVLAGEVASSKGHPVEDGTSALLRSILVEINAKYSHAIYAPFSMPMDCLFQGALLNGRDLLPILLEIRHRMAPYRTKFGVGIGELQPFFPSDVVSPLRGPAYEYARTALESIKESGKKKQMEQLDIFVRSTEEHTQKLKPINTIFSLLTALEQSWTLRQREILWNVLRHKETQMEVASRLGITQSTVQKSLVAANYYTYDAALQTLQEIFEEIGNR